MTPEADLIHQALPIAVTGIFMLFTSLIVLIVCHFSYRTKKSQYESIVRSIETGNPIPEAIAERFGDKAKRDAAHYLLIMAALMSFVLIIVGLGNARTGHNNEPSFWMVTFLGLAGLVASIWILMRRSNYNPSKKDNCGC